MIRSEQAREKEGESEQRSDQNPEAGEAGPHLKQGAGAGGPCGDEREEGSRAVTATARAATESTSQNARLGLRKKSAALVGRTAAAANTARKSRLSPKSYMAPYVCRSGPLVETT